MGISNGVVGVAIDGMQMTIQTVILWMGGLFIIPGVLWVLFLSSSRSRLREGTVDTPLPSADPGEFTPLPDITSEKEGR